MACLTTSVQAEKAGTWIEVRSPHFILVTNANERQGRRAAYQFEMIREVFREFFGKKETQEPPVVIVAAKDEATLKTLLPEFWAKKGSMHPAGIYLGSTDANYVGLRLDVSLDQDAYEPFEPVYHEYVHYLTRRMMAHLPLWMVEGLAEYYGNTRIESKKVFIGAPSTSNGLLLRQTPLLSLNTLFDVDASSPYYHEETKTSIFYAESWALTHYLMTREWKENTHRLIDFLLLLNKGTDQKEAARQTIGDIPTLEQALRKYIQNSSLTALQIPTPKVDESGFQVRALSDAESLAVRGDFTAHDRHFEEGKAMLQQAIAADPKLGSAYESLSFISLQQQNYEDAGKWAEQAVILNPQSNWANYYYAWSLLRAKQDEDSIGKAENSLRTVIKLNPAFAPAYDTLAYALLIPGPRQKLEEAYTMTLYAVENEPGNIHYRLRAVEVLELLGKADNAVRVATLAKSMAKSPEEESMASSALLNAQQFQEFQKKKKEFEEEEKRELASNAPTEADRDKPSEPVATVSKTSLPVRASAEIVVLSNTEGIDFGPYLTRQVLPKLQSSWSKLRVSGTRSEGPGKKNKTVIELSIQKNGAVGGMTVKEASSDPALDAAAVDGLKAAAPFQALPAQFKGKSLSLRFNLSFDVVGDSR